MKKYLLLVLIAGLAFKSVKAQLQIDTAALVNAYFTSQQIFEGMVVAQCCYADNAGIIYTTNTIQISKIFKGSLQCGTVNIITVGGTFNGNTLDVSHTAQFNVGSAGVFACINSTYPSDNSVCPTNVTNDTPLVNVDAYIGNLQYLFDQVNAQVVGFNSMFPTLQSFYDYLASIGMPMNDCGGQIIQQLQAKKTMPYQPFTRTSTKPISTEKINTTPKYKTQIYGKTGPTIYFSISNAGYNSTGSTFQFTVNATSDQYVFLDECTFKITYNAGTFGPSIAGGTTSTIVPTFLLDGSIYTTHSVGNVNTQEFYCTIKAITDPSDRAPLSTSDLPLMQFEIPVVNCKNNPSISFDDYLGAAGDCHYAADSADEPTVFTSTFADYKPDTKTYGSVCFPSTSSLSASNVYGGKKEHLTIYGDDFGNIPGQVFMHDIKSDKSTTVSSSPASFIPINAFDIVSWANDHIVIRVPSDIDSAYNPSSGVYNVGAVGSGELYVVDYWQNKSTTAETVTIDYSLANRSNGYGTYYYQNNQYLFSANSDGIYHFQLNTSIVDPRMINCIKAAFTRWTCYTGVGFVLDAGSTSTPIALDDNNIIAITTFSAPYQNAICMTDNYTNSACSTDSSMVFPTRSNDIEINVSDTSLFIYDTTGTASITSGHYDFFHSFLHELGHAQCLDDVTNTGDLMYYYQSSSGASAANRIIAPTLYAVAGAYFIVDQSTNTSPALGSSCSWDLPLHKYSHPCAPNAGIEKTVANTNYINAFPNPFNDKFEVNLRADISQKAEICVYNSIGQTMINTHQMLNVGENKISFDASSFSNGLYMVYLKTENNSFLIKMICTK